MTMKKLVLLLCLALSLVLATAGLADEVPAGLIGEWEMAGGPVDGTSYGFIFTETEMTMTITEYGETQSETMAYVIEGDAIVANDTPEKFVLDGDTLTIGDEDFAMTFTRKGAVPAASTVPAGLIGEWEMTGTEGMDYWDEDESAGIIFTETTMTMLEDGEGYDMPYTINGEYIVANGVSVRFVLDGDTFKMYNGNEGLIFTRKGAAPDASVLLGEWKLLGPVDEASQNWMPEGYEAYFIFTETEMSAKVVFNGEEQTNSAEYTVEGNRLVQDVSDMTWAMDGEYLILTEDGVSLRFERVSTGIVGEWDVVELIGAEGDEAAQGMEMIKALGGSIQIIFTETEMTLRMSFMGENMDETTTYTIVGNEIVADGEGVPFVLEGDRLTISDDEIGFVLVRAGMETEATEAEAVETPSKTGVTSPIGEWTLVAMTGSEEAEQMWQLVSLMGGSITLTVTENTATLTMNIMDEVETEETPCTVNGNVVTLEGGSTIVLENDQLILTEDGMSMVFEQK